MVHPTSCFSLSFLAALFINQRRQHSPLKEGMIWGSHKKMKLFFSEAGRFHYSIVAIISYHQALIILLLIICDQSKSLVHIITWLKARSWKCEIWIRSYPWIWMDTSYAKGNKVAISKENISRAAFQQHCPLKHDFVNLHFKNSLWK